jgi:hypothetical protein
MRDAVAHGEASSAHLAYPEDRVRVRTGQPQLYGTEFTVTGGNFGLYPIEDLQRLDERRAEPSLNRSLSTKPGCEPGRSEYSHQNTLFCREAIIRPTVIR